MVVVKPGTPIPSTTVPILQVDIDPQAPMLSGRYTFQLIVQDSDNAISDPTTVTVVILDNIKPTAVIDGPQSVQVGFGQGFTLTAKGSHANAPAVVRTYMWSLVSTG